MGAPGLLSRMFCFSAGARVRSEPRRRTPRGRAEDAAVAAPPPSGSPTAAEAIAAYLGRQPVTAPTSLPPRDKSAEESVPQSSTYNSAVSSLDSGGSGGPVHDPGYEADSDDDFQPSSEESVTSRGRRFRPAARHHKVKAEQELQLAAAAEAADGAAVEAGSTPETVAAVAAGGAVGELVEQFERLSISSGSRCGSPGSAGGRADSEQEPPTVPAVRAQAACPWLGTSTCTAEVHVHLQAGTPSQASASGGSRPGTAGLLPPPAAATAAATAAAPAGSKTMSRCSSAASLAASGSISLAHFLGGDSAAGSSRSNSFKVRRLGSTQVVVADPDSPAAHSARSTVAAEGAAAAIPPGPSAAAAPSKPPLLPKSDSGSSTGTNSSGSGRAAQLHLQPGAALVVQRRLNEIQSGHYITFEKLRSQCGDFQEPPGDLLSLMARRVFASRSSSVMQRLCSEGLLSDLQAGDSGQPTPSQGTGALHSPRAPARAAPQPPAAAQQAAAEQAETPAVVEMGDGLPRLPRIRTRVGQPRLEGTDGSSEGGSCSGSSSGKAAELCVQ